MLINSSALEASVLDRTIEALGIATRDAHEVLLYNPVSYADYTKVMGSFAELASAKTGDQVCVLGKVHSITFFSADNKETTLFSKGAERPVRANVVMIDRGFKEFSAGAFLSVSIFGNVWALRDNRKGDELFVTGKADRFNGKPQIKGAQIIPMGWANRVFPVYPAIRGRVSAEDVYLAIQAALLTPGLLEQAAAALQEKLELGVDVFEKIARTDACKLLQTMHSPRKVEHGLYCLEAARRLSVVKLWKAARDQKSSQPNARSMLRIGDDVIDRTMCEISNRYTLTSDQKCAVEDILEDLRSPHRMKRLLSGDVGTGKSITFIGPAVCVHRAGHRPVIMAPNELVVNQIADEIVKLFPGSKVQKVGAKTRKIDSDAILVGTTALISRVKKADLDVDFMVVDEQHKFSREQREALLSHGTNYLEATATPIPRTMALVTHSGMSTSQLRERPYQRNVRTKLVDKSAQRELFDLVKSTVLEGKQVAIIYPAVEKSESMIDVDSAAQWWVSKFPDRVIRLHGKMTQEQKEEGIDAFRQNKANVLVASTLIEVGVSLPDLKAIIIVNADRYGVAQLHQLRGRVARNGGDGDCMLYCPTEITEETLERLKALENTDDGFRLAEIDLKQRGFGDLLLDSNQQSGKAVNVFHNIKLTPEDLEQTRRAEKVAKMSA